MFGNLGFTEILLIMMLALLLFGAKRIPEIAGSFGKGIKEFKKNMTDVTNPDVTPPADNARLRGPDAVQTSDAREESRPEPKRLI